MSYNDGVVRDFLLVKDFANKLRLSNVHNWHIYGDLGGVCCEQIILVLLGGSSQLVSG